ncbi:UDP-glucose 4-epimerase protein [Halorhabdus tiamatea SARL4B]|uniref:UDP-glucose 4-epimerase n=1 Tax=Halorhabdus tiamatea SARL4B TaxID=1033806 RepID=F7PQ58_9EURY|nr:NAD(P)-dependent oxidoreductase [Halorhabdus tiamatea]ERJ05030.1 UDP-glucose 4-epimerase protein [Halorhabdus tiamatea SARL4B]CCQ33103.1 UDP-glucose 4-epimerase [Halorhabdus tiamatea SARL4B]
MDVLVTGGMGYIGSALLPLLADAPDVDRIVVLDSLASGSPRHLLEARVDGDLDFRRGDVREYGNVENAMSDVDTVIHLAAITGAASTHDRREETMAVNLEGTENVVNAARKLGVETLVFASSCNNYGRAATTDIDETTEPDPLNPYAEAKVAAEESVAEFAAETGANATALRMSTNYGYAPGVRFNLVVNHFVFRALTGRPLTVYGDGSNWRPFIHVRDSARAFAHAARNPDSWPKAVYNVGSDAGNYRISEIAAVVSEEVAPVDVTYLEDEHPGPSYHVNFDRLAETGFEPEWTLREGVRDLATVLRDRQEINV